MPHVLSYAGQYCRIEVTEVASIDDPEKSGYVGWRSDHFKELKDAPNHACSVLIDGPPLASHDEALRNAYDRVKALWDARQAKPAYKDDHRWAVIYTVSILQGGNSVECQFVEFEDAKIFAKAAEKIMDVKTVWITNNESPQHLTRWQRAT